MDIDIGQIGVNLNIDDREWKATYHKLAAVAVQNSAIEQEILNVAAVDENGNIIPIRTSQLRQTDIATHFKIQIRCRDFHHFLSCCQTIDSCNSLTQITTAGSPCHFAAVTDKGESHFRMGQTKPINHINDMGQLSLLTLHILEPGGSIEEEIFYLDFRSHRTVGRLMLFNFTALGN